MREGYGPLGRQEKNLMLVKGVHKNQHTEWLLMHLLHFRSLTVLTWRKHYPEVAQTSLLGLDHRSESRSSLTENDYIRNLNPYNQRIQQIVKGIEYMGGKWARSWSPRFDFKLFVWRLCQPCEFGLLFSHCLVQYESCLLQVYMFCETQRKCV